MFPPSPGSLIEYSRHSGDFLGVLPKIHGHQLRHTLFHHCYAIHHIRFGHRGFVVGDDYELRILGEGADDFAEFANVSIVQRRINLIENTEWRWLEQVNTEKQRCGG